MRSGQELYNDPRTAAGYAFARPAVHPRILAQVGQDLGLTRRVARALDIGCGAGRSTAALEPLARAVVGIDPWPAMLAHRREVAPGAAFVVGTAERLPFVSASFDLVTAAGAINYTDLDVSLPEIARTLCSTGTFVIYDFSAGRRFADRRDLEDWYPSSTNVVRKRPAITSTSSVFPTSGGDSASTPITRSKFPYR